MPDGGAGVVDDITEKRGELAGPGSRLLPFELPDELPDGLVVADDAGRVIIFNKAASRLTGIPAEEALGKFASDVLPFRDSDGCDWWMFVDPYHGLSTRTRHPERSLYLGDGPELLISVGYVRERGAPVRRLIISLRDAQQRARLERSRAELVRRPRAAVAAD
jgi:PAS domain-containing protein